MKKIIIIVIIVALVAAGGFFGYQKYKSKDNNKDGIPVRTEKLKKDSLRTAVTVKGNVDVENKEVIYVSTAQRVDEVMFDEGDEVKKGETIILFDDGKEKEYKRRIEIEKINIKNTEINLLELQNKIDDKNIRSMIFDIDNNKDTMKEYDLSLENLDIELTLLRKDKKSSEEEVAKNKKLYDSGFISYDEYKAFKDKDDQLRNSILLKENQVKDTNLKKSTLESKLKYLEQEYKELLADYDKAEITRQREIEKARNSIELNKIRIEEYEEELKKIQAKVDSPVDGTIIYLEAEKNFTVDVEKKLVEIADISNLIIKVNVPEYDVTDIKIGATAEITADSLKDKTYIGKITKISSLAKKQPRNEYEESTVEVEISFENQENILKPGFFVDVDIITSEKEEANIISILSVLRDKNKSYVFVINSEKKAEKRYVDLGMENDLNVEILSGIEADEEIILNPGNDIKEGVLVVKSDKSSSNNKGKGRNRNGNNRRSR